MVIVFLGPDGSGKSTIIQRLIDGDGLPYHEKYLFHLRPGIFENKQAVSIAVTDPHALPPRGTLSTMLKLVYWWVDYLAGYLLNIRSWHSESALIIFDRYYHDILVDPRRYRLQNPLWLARMIGYLIPRPHSWILLNAPAEVIQSRKQEVPFQETERQCKDYLEFINTVSNGYVLNATLPVEQIVEQAKRLISNKND